MPLPTLLQKGFLKPQPWMSANEKKKIEAQIPIDYIMNFMSDRIPASKGGKAKITPKKFGDKVLVLKSSTGSGKSTTLPTSIYTNFIERMGKNISCLQPRILTCIDIPSSILQFSKDLEMGKNIGYSTGKFKNIPKEKGIIFSTYGVVTQQILSAETPEEFMSIYGAIIVDEVHTRSTEEDSLLFLLKKLLVEYYDDPECPILILTSATFDESIFMEYFEVPRENYMIIEGFAYPKTEFYPKYDIIDYNRYAILKSLQIHIDNIADVAGKESSEFRDIVIFVPTSSIGEKMVAEFHHYNSTIMGQEFDKIIKWKEKELDPEVDKLYIKNDNPITGGDEESSISPASRFYILPILLTKASFESGGLQYQNMFSNINTISLPIWKPNSKGEIDLTSRPDKFAVPSRRIIIGTNIMETGITVDSLRYCIDTGFELHVEFNPDYAAPLMVQKGCTQGMVIQRKGRVGRKSPGFWYPCFTQDTFNKMQKDQYADIIMADPVDNLLNIIINETETKIVEEESKAIINNEEKRKEKQLFQRNYISNGQWWKLDSKKTFNIGGMDFLEMPSGPSLQYAVEKLHALGMIDDAYNTTLFGYLANLIRFISLESKRMIFGGFACGASIMDLITIAAFIHTSKRSIFGKKYRTPNILGKPNFDFIYKVLIGDELIGCILLWNDFNDWINSKITKLFKGSSGTFKTTAGMISVDAVKQWCHEKNILYDGWIIMIANRDVLIENLITIGINVHYNTADEPAGKFNLKQLMLRNLDEGLTEVKKIKEAIYSGYYLNLCQWNEAKRVYMLNSHNIPIQTKSDVLPYLNPVLAKQTKPKFMVVTNYLFNQSQTNSQFEFSSSGFISVMDNYVNVDLNLNIA
jgi:hypothetical protein